MSTISTSTNIHNGSEIEYKRVQFRDFWTHRFTVTTTDGLRHEFDVFAYKKIDLEWLPNELAGEMKRAPVEPSDAAPS